MIKKVQIIVYKKQGSKIQYFIGKRSEKYGGIWQPPTGHVEEADKTLPDTAMRELHEELGISHFKSFTNLGKSFNFQSASGKKYEEHIFAVDIGEQNIKLEKAEFVDYKFLPLEKAVVKLNYDSHRKFMKLSDEAIKAKQYPKILIICGPSGSGKDSIIEALLQEKKLNLEPIKSATTRKKRKNDRSNRIYLSKKEFEQRDRAGEFVEKNFFNGNWYATLRGPIEEAIKQGRNIIIEIDINGVKSFKKEFSNVVAIFVKSKISELKERILNRGENSDKEVANRLNVARVEMRQAGICDHIVENKQSQLKQTISKIIKIAKGEL